jgi:hypothetical protein
MLQNAATERNWAWSDVPKVLDFAAATRDGLVQFILCIGRPLKHQAFFDDFRIYTHYASHPI